MDHTELLSQQEISRQTHYSLRKNLITLHRHPPANSTNLESLRNGIAAQMRTLHDTHLAIYNHKYPQNPFNPNDPQSIRQFIDWRIRQLDSRSYDPNSESALLKKQDSQEYQLVFKPQLWKNPRNYPNNWQIVVHEPNQPYYDFYVHSQVTFDHLMAGYIPNRETLLFSSNVTINGIASGDLQISNTLGQLANTPPDITIESNGSVKISTPFQQNLCQ